MASVGTKESASHIHQLTSNLLCVFFLSAVGIGQAVIPLGLSFHRLEMIAFSLQFFIKGFKGQLTKAGKGPFLSLSKEPGDN
jgi:hypothetical protein